MQQDETHIILPAANEELIALFYVQMLSEFNRYRDLPFFADFYDSIESGAILRVIIGVHYCILCVLQYHKTIMRKVKQFYK